MKPTSFMFIAGEASGDLSAAELVQALRREFATRAAVATTDLQPLRTSLEPRFFGAGGQRMAAAGVELAFDLTQHSVTGVSDVLKNYLRFRRLFHQLLRVAFDRRPDVIVCVDFAGFNLRFAHAVRRFVRARQGWFHAWRPRIVQFVSPQVWASRPGRAFQVARDHDLLLAILPFEKAWYARRVPSLPVEFVGHPIVDRHINDGKGTRASSEGRSVLLLPGSRAGELTRHLPAMLGALPALRDAVPNLRLRMVLPQDSLVQLARSFAPPADLEIRCGGLSEALKEADVAIASTGTVTMECAYFGVPTVALYKTSWITYHIARRIILVRYLAMPNLLADEELYPELIQDAASPSNLAAAALDLLRDEARCRRIKARLAEVVASLGGPGASARAAKAIAGLL